MSSELAAFLQTSPPAPPIIVKIIQPEAKSDLEGLSDILLGSLGLTGIITLGALLLGVVMAGVMFWVRSRSASRDGGGPEGPPLRL
jgi:hypothetical protein